jgi:hypothetical protein
MKVVDIYKGVRIVESQEVEGMFHCEHRHIFGESIEEVKYDLNDTMTCIEYARINPNYIELDNDELCLIKLRGAFVEMGLTI